VTKTARLAGNVGRVVTQDELAENQQRYRVRERDWLELEIAYEGRGEAEFSPNPGTIWRSDLDSLPRGRHGAVPDDR
jgi:hypothetical protein